MESLHRRLAGARGTSPPTSSSAAGRVFSVFARECAVVERNLVPLQV